MKKRALIAALAITMGASAFAGDTAVKAQTTCPVMGGGINKTMYADVEGKRIYVCCGGCIDTIKKDPAKYIKIAEDKGETLEVITK